MREYALGVGDELVIGGGTRLTLLAVEAGEVLFGLTAPEPGDVPGPEAGDRRPVGRASDLPRGGPFPGPPPKKAWPG
jgi:hypothetical protein